MSLGGTDIRQIIFLFELLESIWCCLPLFYIELMNVEFNLLSLRNIQEPFTHAVSSQNFR